MKMNFVGGVLETTFKANKIILRRVPSQVQICGWCPVYWDPFRFYYSDKFLGLW